jgi:AraC-like DNA-binding protein
MKPSLTLLAILNLVGAAQGLLLTLALLTVKGGNETANRILAALTLTISIVVGGAVLVTTNYVFVFPQLSRLHHPFVFLAGPLLFLYIRALTTGEKTIAKKDFFHFVPFTLCLLYLLPYYFQGRAAKLASLYAEFNEQSLGEWYYIRSALFIFQFLIYLLAIIAILLKYRRTVTNDESPSERVILFKLRFFVIASVILWAGAILRLIFDESASSNLLVPLGASILVYVMGYLEMTKTERVIGPKELAPSKKYEKSSLTPDRSQRYLEKLIQFMEAEKPYIDGSLTVQKLAEKLSISTPHLSQTINEQLGQTFSDFLNSYRVEEAKKRLLDPAFRHLSVLGIAEDVGFNSKSSFNSVFKKHTNTTPSEFRNGVTAAKKLSH